MTTVRIDSMLEMQSKADFNEAKTAFEVFTDCKDIVERCNREFQTAIVAIQPVILEKWLEKVDEEEWLERVDNWEDWLESVNEYQTDSGEDADNTYSFDTSDYQQIVDGLNEILRQLDDPIAMGDIDLINFGNHVAGVLMQAYFLLRR